MFRLWVKEWKDNHLIRDTVVEDATQDTRTHKVLRGLEEACVRFDLGVPIWLDATVEEFRRSARARFYEDAFVEEVGFYYLEIQMIEEDNNIW